MLADWFSFLCEVGNGGEHRPALVVRENQDGSCDVLVFHVPSDGTPLVEYKPRVREGNKINQLSVVGNVETDTPNTLEYDAYGNPLNPANVEYDADGNVVQMKVGSAGSRKVRQAKSVTEASQDRDQWGREWEFDPDGNRINKDQYGNIIP